MYRPSALFHPHHHMVLALVPTSRARGVYLAVWYGSLPSAHSSPLPHTPTLCVCTPRETVKYFTNEALEEHKYSEAIDGYQVCVWGGTQEHTAGHMGRCSRGAPASWSIASPRCCMRSVTHFEMCPCLDLSQSASAVGRAAGHTHFSIMQPGMTHLVSTMHTWSQPCACHHNQAVNGSRSQPQCHHHSTLLLSCLPACLSPPPQNTNTGC
jgi:hypothetical protein